MRSYKLHCLVGALVSVCFLVFAFAGCKKDEGEAEKAKEPAKKVEPAVAKKVEPAVAKKVEPAVAKKVEPAVAKEEEPAKPAVAAAVVQELTMAEKKVIKAIQLQIDVLESKAKCPEPKKCTKQLTKMIKNKTSQVMKLVNKKIKEPTPAFIAECKKKREHRDKLLADNAAVKGKVQKLLQKFDKPLVKVCK